MNLKHGPAWICPECHDPNRKYCAKNLCSVCYARMLRRKLGMKPNNRGKYSECQQCGKKQIRALGLCTQCYNRILEIKNINLRKQQKYHAGQKHRFGGREEWILVMANYRCQICGMTEEESIEKWNRKLDIHHNDGNGRTSDNPNHEIDNLLVVCRRCHMAIHHPKGEKISAGGVK